MKCHGRNRPVYTFNTYLCYFLFLFNQASAKKAKEHKQMTENLKRGDQIVTSGGIIGTVERVMDNDRAEVIVADDTKVEIVRSTGVQGLIKAEEPKK